MTANVDDLLHRRVLITSKEHGSYFNHAQKVEEIKILELSPSKKWLKIQNENGQRFWRNVDDITPIEILDFIVTDKPKT